jgi:hypothetical protein
MSNDQTLTPEAQDLVREYYAGKRRERRGSWLSALAGAGLAVVIMAGIYSVPVSVADTATQEKNQAVSSKQDLASQASQLSDRTLEQCLFGDDQTKKTLTDSGSCAEAQQLKQAIIAAIPVPAAGSTGQPGKTGSTGANGRGIASTAIVGGRFQVTYSDGTTEDKGQIVGQNGVKGDTGRGITGSSIGNGHLTLTYSDGTSEDLGQVVGRDGKDGVNGVNGTNGANGQDGRGISSVGIVNGHLIVNYTDGSATDLGALPPGPPGNNGEPPTGWTQTYSNGKVSTCSRVANFDYSNPQYSCAAPVTPSSSAPPTS